MDNKTVITTQAVLTTKSAIADGTGLVIIRHGEAHCNVEEVIGGVKSCRGLTALGVAQTECLAERLSRTGELAHCRTLWSSVLPRAVQTAQILARVLRLPLEQSAGFSEREPGEADGLSWAEFERRYQKSSRPNTEPDAPLAPGGESWIDFVGRASTALLELARANPGALNVVVAHGGVIDSSLISFLEIPEFGTRVRLHPHHTSLTEWRYSNAHWRLVRYNDAAHLTDQGRLGSAPVVPGWVDS